MLTIEEALAAVRERTSPLPCSRTLLGDALGMVLGENVESDIDIPPFDKALMDGYAVRGEDIKGGSGRLLVVEEILAGKLPTRTIGVGEAAAIMTGAPMPGGADSVVVVEMTRREGGEVVIEDPSFAPGKHLMRRGREMRAGERVLQAGVLLNSVKLGLLAAVGRAKVTMVSRPRVAILATGDELVEPGQVPGPGQIRNSNATMLRALARNAGAEVELLPIARDEMGELRGALGRGLKADVLLVTGGVSAGNRDLVPEALHGLGVERVFHKIRMKPGKPLWFGVGKSRTGGAAGPLVFGLPGNPVSGVVGFMVFVRPALEGLSGREARWDRTIGARLGSSFRHVGDRPTYYPSRVESGGLDGKLAVVNPLAWGGSADLRTVAGADGFVVFEAGNREYQAGEIVRFLGLE